MTATPDTSTRKVGTPLSQAETIASLSRYGYGWVDSDVAAAAAPAASGRNFTTPL